MTTVSIPGQEYVLGARVEAARASEIVTAILERARQGRPGGVFLANVHMLVERRRNRALAGAMEAAPLVVADGMPVAWWLRLKGHPGAERLAGIDLMLGVCEIAAREGLPVLVYGGTDQADCDLVRERLLRKAPGLPLRVVPAPWIEDPARPDRIFAETVREWRPSLAFVCLGCPKQEIWINHNAQELDGPVIGVGAAFEFLSEKKKRAPGWMQSVGMEWLYRLAHEPRRLFRRYAETNLAFVFLGLIDLWRHWWRKAKRRVSGKGVERP